MKRQHMQRIAFLRKHPGLVLCLLGLVALVTGGVVYYRMKFPFGQSHCCILQMAGALEQFAEENGGRYPTGGSTSEASLGLLYKSNYLDAYILRGMTVPELRVRAVLERGGELGPDSCGWHYVPGLTRADDPKIAMLWCKAALGHNGQRTKDRGRQVVFVGGEVNWVSGGKWPEFIEEQKQLLAKRDQRSIAGIPLVVGTIEMPDGKPLEAIDGVFTISEESKTPDSSGHSTSSGTLSKASLVWFHAPFQDGSVTRTISFSNLVSAPVTIAFSNGIPDKTNLVYRMRTKSVQ